MNVHEYILKNWKRTIRNPKNREDSKLALLKLPCPYTTPCADEMFKNFYYWDTYFTNLGLLEDNKIDIARSNTMIMDFLVKKIGFIPNADHLIFGSQPPFFTRTVYDLYKKTKNVEDINQFIDSIIEEHKFWENDRITSIGLNQYKCGFPKKSCVQNYDYFVDRVSGLNESEKKIDKILFTQGCYAIAESGWDINTRYERANNRFASLDFVNIDLNSILYDAEIKLSEMLKIVGRIEESNKYLEKANQRKDLINKYCLESKTKFYKDYCFVDKTLSIHLSAASLYPYAFGISDDKDTFKVILDRLLFENGLSVGEKDKNTTYFQWDYPNMWPPVVYIAFVAAKRLGLEDKAQLIKKKYMETVDKNFEETGDLWEKYNAVTGGVSFNAEYKTPKMLGWTAGVYEFLLNN